MEENGVSVKLSNPYKTKAIAEAKVKTDKIDARTLAQLLRADLVAECYVPSREDREKRALIRERASMTKIRTELRNKIHDLLAKYEYSHGFSGPTLCLKLVSVDLPYGFFPPLISHRLLNASSAWRGL